MDEEKFYFFSKCCAVFLIDAFFLFSTIVTAVLIGFQLGQLNLAYGILGVAYCFLCGTASRNMLRNFLTTKFLTK